MSKPTAKNKNTGLGASVFFPKGEDDTQAAPAVTAATKSAAPKKPVRPKTRTTVILYNDTLEAIELLKAQSRKNGVKASMSDILNDAVELLIQDRNKPTE